MAYILAKNPAIQVIYSQHTARYHPMLLLIVLAVKPSSPKSWALRARPAKIPSPAARRFAIRFSGADIFVRKLAMMVTVTSVTRMLKSPVAADDLRIPACVTKDMTTNHPSVCALAKLCSTVSGTSAERSVVPVNPRRLSVLQRRGRRKEGLSMHQPPGLMMVLSPSIFAPDLAESFSSVASITVLCFVIVDPAGLAWKPALRNSPVIVAEPLFSHPCLAVPDHLSVHTSAGGRRFVVTLQFHTTVIVTLSPARSAPT